MTVNDLIELYSNIEDFYHRYIKTDEGKRALGNYYGKRGPKRKLTVPEVMTLNIMKIMYKVKHNMLLYFIKIIRAFPQISHR